MRPLTYLSSVIILLLLATTAGFCQTDCTFTLVGTWESIVPDQTNPTFYEFASNGTVRAFSYLESGVTSPTREIAQAAYKLTSNDHSPKTIEFRTVAKGGALPLGTNKVEIVKFNNTTFTSITPDARLMNWVRTDPHKYFVVFAAQHGTPQDGGPAFAMLIKSGNDQMDVETFGLYHANNRKVTGPIPAEVYKHFINEPPTSSDALLRLKVTKEEFERSMQIMHSWQRRAREGALLFPGRSYLNSIVPIKEIAESLNQCTETIKLYQLNWRVEDEIGSNYGLPEVSFQYVKKLRELNDAMHVRDENFQQTMSGKLERLPSGK